MSSVGSHSFINSFDCFSEDSNVHVLWIIIATWDLFDHSTKYLDEIKLSTNNNMSGNLIKAQIDEWECDLGQTKR